MNAETCVNKIAKLLNLCRQVENVIPKVTSVEILNSLMNLKERKDSFSRALNLFCLLWRGDLINDLTDFPKLLKLVFSPLAQVPADLVASSGQTPGVHHPTASQALPRSSQQGYQRLRQTQAPLDSL